MSNQGSHSQAVTSGGSYFFASSGTGVLGPIGTLTATPDPTECDIVGHQLDGDELTAYPDGQAFATCQTCGETIRFYGLKDGDLLARAKELVDRVMRLGLQDDTQEALEAIVASAAEMSDSLLAVTDTIDLLMKLIDAR